MTEGSFAAITIAQDQKSDTTTFITLTMADPEGRFEPLATSVEIPAGALSKQIVLQSKNDGIFQGPKAFTLTATNQDSQSDNQQALLIINLVDDETIPKLSVNNSSANENAGSMSFTVTADKTSSMNMEVSLISSNGTEIAPGDYTAVTASQLVIPAGQTSATANIPLINDAVYEGNETFSVTMSAPINAEIQTVTGVGTIQNDDAMPIVNLSASSSTQLESAGSISLQLTLNTVSDVDVVVPYTLSGTALSGLDCSLSLPSPITIPAGTLTKSFNINIADDSLSEFSETAIINLGTPTDGALGTTNTYTLTITDNDMVTANFVAASQNTSEATGVLADWHASMSNWSSRRRLEIVGLASSISNFPIRIKLDSSRITYAQLQSQGQDLRFIDDSGTLLPHEVEIWNSSGTSEVWVRIPTVAAAPARTGLWMYYGNVSAPDGQSKTNVWDSNFTGVWHFNGNALDSTANIKDGTVTGVSYASGLVGNAASLNGVTGNNIKLPDSMAVNNVLTISLAFKTSTYGSLFGHSSAAYSGTPTGWNPMLYVDTNGKLRGGVYTTSIPSFVSSKSVNDNQWHYATWTGNTTIQSLYLDGDLVGTVAGTFNLASMTTNYIGFSYWNSWNYVTGVWNTANGLIDEVSISNVARSATWVAYNNASLRDGLIFFANEENNATSGVVNILVQLDSAAINNVTIPYTVSGTSTPGVDHTLSSGSLVIASGNSSGTIPIRIIKDATNEPTETLIMTMGTLVNALAGSTTTHTINIADDPNVTPVATTDSYTVTALMPQSYSVLDNDTDANNDFLNLLTVSSPSYGTAAISGRYIIYTPASTFGANDSFTYTISDGRGGSATSTVNITYQVPFTWTGDGTNSLWSNGQNWVGGVAPGASNTVYFNNQCSTNCSPTFNAAAAVSGLRMHSTYNGTIAQGTGYTMAVGGDGWIQEAGTFIGSNVNLTISGAFSLTGGSFKNSTALNTFSSNFNDTGEGTYDGTVGTTQFNPGYQISPTLTSANRTFANLTFSGSSTTFIVTGNITVSSGLVLRNADYGCTLSGGTINLKGNLTLDSTTNSSRTACDGSTLIVLNGNSDQTITGNSYFGRTPRIEIASTGGNVYLVSKISVWNGFKHTSGNLITTGSVVKLNGLYSSTMAVEFNSTQFSELHMAGSVSVINVTGTAFVSGDLHISNYGYSTGFLNGGQINVNGNLYSDGAATGVDVGMRGTTLINMVGSTPQHIYGITGTYFGSLPKVTIDSTSTVTLHDRVRFGNNFTHLNSAGVTTTGSTVSFYSYYMNTLHSPTGITFNDVQIDGSGNAVIDFGGVALNVGGNFFINESYSCNLNNTTVSISGNFTSSGSYGGCLGNASFNLVGNTNTTMGASSGGTLFYFPSGNITVNKTGGASVSLSGKINANSAGQTVNLIAGSINLSGSQLYAKGLSLNGNTLYLSGGTLYINNVNTTDGTPHGGTISP